MTITLRMDKGSALTYGELDENFRDLRYDTTIDRVLNNGNVSANSLTVQGVTTQTVTTNSMIIASSTPPAANSSTGTTGQIAWDQNYVYVCVSPNKWKRSALSNW